ncbi:hypothetical protein ACFLT2_10835 [Acidobacteriota bacterium]
MLIKIFFKEWRENILIFLLSLFLLLALVVLNFSGQKELTMYFSGMFLWLFLPFAALLIGSSGYYSEFKDNAWIYMFSRPVKKWQLWLVKFIALLSIFFVIFLIFYALLKFLPGLSETVAESGLLFMMEGLLKHSPYLVISLLALAISYSISFLSEKQFVVVFASVLIGASLVFATWQYYEFLIMTYFYSRSIEWLILFFGLSFLAASILVFGKIDFSQKGKKIFHFTKYLLIFLVLSFVIHTAWITKGKMFTARTWIPSDFWHKIDDVVYLYSYQHGIIKYESQADQITKLNRASRFSYGGFSVDGDKIAFIKVIRRMRIQYTNLWTMNSDGSDAKVEIETNKPDTPFYGKTINSCLLSSSGDQLAFVTEPWSSESDPNPILWWTEADGTRVRKIEMNLPRHFWFHLVYWSDKDNRIFLTAQEKTERTVPNKKLIEVNIGTGNHRILFENILLHNMIPVSPQGEYFVLRQIHSEEQKANLLLFNLKTYSVKDIFTAKAFGVIRIKWNSAGSQIIFSRKAEGMELWAYKLEDNTAKKIDFSALNHGLGYDWLAQDNRIVLSDQMSGETWLRVLDDDLNELKKIRLPDHLQRHWNIWGLDNAVLVQRSRRGGFWRLDLLTEEWKKVF